MNDPKIPNYPVVHVTVQPDGSAHVNAAGDHQNYPAGDVDETRERVLAYAIAVATRLGRGVRMTTVDPDGEWKLGVYPDGEVVDLAPAPLEGRRLAKGGFPRRRPAMVADDELPFSSESNAVVTERLAAPHREPPPAVRDALRRTRTLAAVLKFSTGDTAIIGPPAIIGRNPGSVVTDLRGSQLVVVTDYSRTVSRAHANVGWIGGKLTISDRGAGNGTAVTRLSAGRFELATGKPYELFDGDLLHFGTDVTCSVAMVDQRETETP